MMYQENMAIAGLIAAVSLFVMSWDLIPVIFGRFGK